MVAESKLIINATPVGTWPNVEDAPRIPYAYLTPEHHLLDLVYNPPLTQFLAYGQQRGAKIMNGERMFRGQAAAGWAIWSESSVIHKLKRGCRLWQPRSSCLALLEHLVG